ncbi:MAG: carotenoid 1,2-hydratase [Betaproteobacteria bacterium]|nr:carotenoid 1,2-hydratase [Betaproteobacteria bacterium]
MPGYRLRFPHDEGSHPDFRLEWWYVTGWLNEASKPLGFQITFFRARPELNHDNPSAFTPRQIMIAHAALSDPFRGRLIHAQRAARQGFGLAGADRGRTGAWIYDWRLEQAGDSYHARITGRQLSMELGFAVTQPPLNQGQEGYSRKGPAPEHASYYYSLPHLKVSGTIARDGAPKAVTGSAWLDHEWSSSYMAEQAVGWDWIGINLADGGALMAFRMRDQQGGSFWAGGALRHPDGRLKVFLPDEVRFVPRREWRSARTGTTYPVSFLVRAGDREFAIEPLFDDQEHDTRASTGTIYWEGAVRALRDGKAVGLGYLELTGYWRRVEL